MSKNDPKKENMQYCEVTISAKGIKYILTPKALSTYDEDHSICESNLGRSTDFLDHIIEGLEGMEPRKNVGIFTDRGESEYLIFRFHGRTNVIRSITSNTKGTMIED